MPETRRRLDPEFREGAVRIVRETGKPTVVVARELGITDGTLGKLGQEGPPGPRRGRGPGDR
jgi:transposase-like protein